MLKDTLEWHSISWTTWEMCGNLECHNCNVTVTYGVALVFNCIYLIVLI